MFVITYSHLERMDEFIVNADGDMELFDREVLNQVSYGLKDIPYNLSICNYMSDLAGDNEIENNPVLTNMMAGEKNVEVSNVTIQNT